MQESTKYPNSEPLNVLKWQFYNIKNLKNWFHVKSDWQKNPEISTLYDGWCSKSTWIEGERDWTFHNLLEMWITWMAIFTSFCNFEWKIVGFCMISSEIAKTTGKGHESDFTICKSSETCFCETLRITFGHEFSVNVNSLTLSSNLQFHCQKQFRILQIF